MGYKAFFLIWSMSMILNWLAPVLIWAEQGPSVVVHFDNGQSFLSSEDKTRLRTLFRDYAIGSESRVFILGYTDAVGDANGNYRLSRKRAQSVRREIISSFGIDATIVMAMGKGEENPVADNRKARGRALNRRAEIYLANTALRKPSRVYGPKDPYLPAIQTLLKEAEVLIKRQQLNDAIRKLDEARTMGGDHYSDWHAAYGITGYYANAPNEQIESHFQAALRLDSYNYKAREYLSRVQARRKVADGDVSGRMGRTADTAIAVTAVAQEHEYLRLFNVEPLKHVALKNMPVNAWECLDARGARVVYYFNHAGTYAWAFGRQAKARPPQTVPASTSSMRPASSAPRVESPIATVHNDAVHNGSLPVPEPRKIWESKVFK